VLHIIFFCSLVLYVLGKFLKETVEEIYEDYIVKKNNEIIMKIKAGNEKNIANKDIENSSTESNIDLKTEGNTEEFVELIRNIAKE
jgi:hypothetical protein